MSRAGRKPSPCHRGRKRRIAFEKLCKRQPITCRPHGGTLFIGGQEHLKRHAVDRNSYVQVPVFRPVPLRFSERNAPIPDMSFETQTQIYQRQTFALGTRRVDLMVLVCNGIVEPEFKGHIRQIGLQLMQTFNKLAAAPQVWRRLPSAFCQMEPTPDVSDLVRANYRGRISDLCRLDDWMISAISGPGWTIKVPHLGIDAVLP